MEEVLAMLKGRGGTTSFRVVLTQELEVLAKQRGVAKSFNLLKGGHEKFYLLSRGGWEATHNFPIL